MRPDKKILRFAKKLVQLSIVDGEVSSECVSGVLASLRKAPPSNLRVLLKTYHRLLSVEIAKRTAVVESASALSGDVLEAIERYYSELYGYPVKSTTKTNPELIAGIRVQIGDDRFDASVQGRLQRLAANVR